MKKITINIKFLIFFLIFFLIVQNFNLPKNIFSVVKHPYAKRVVNAYPYCHNESIGFLNYLKNKYNFKDKIEIRNYFISPDPSWFFFKTDSNKLIKDKMILLGYEENIQLEFENRSNYYFSNKSIKILKFIKNISFDLNNINNEKKIKFKIFQKTFDDMQLVYQSSFLENLKKNNLINIDLKLTNTINNSRPIIQFVDSENNIIGSIQNLKAIIQNNIDLKNHIIYEKENNCYLISKND